MLAEFAIVLAFYIVGLSVCAACAYAGLIAWAYLKALISAWQEWAQARLERQGRL